jgi:O-antigen ligase
MIYLLCGYIWLFIHRPFEVWPWMADLRIERVYMLATIAYWALFAEKSWTSNRLNSAFALLALSIMASAVLGTYSAGYPLDNPAVENWLKVAVFYVLVMSSVRDERDLKILVTMFVVSMGLYMAHSYREYLCGRCSYSVGMGVNRMVGVDSSFGDPNTFAGTVTYGLPMVYPAWLLARNRWQRLLLVGYVALSAVCILQTGSRTAFAGLLVLAGIAALGSRHRVRWAILACITVPIICFGLREDLQKRYLTLVDSSAGNEQAKGSAQGRTEDFFTGIEMWKRSPVLGVGPACTGKARGTKAELFNLYGQVLGDLGTLGALALLTVIGAMVANAIEMRRLTRHGGPDVAFLRRVSTAVLLTLCLLLVLGWGGNNLYRYTWLWFAAFQAIALRCVAQTEYSERNTVPREGPAEDVKAVPI